MTLRMHTSRLITITKRAPTLHRTFSTIPSLLAKNRLYPARIRNDDELQTLILMSASSRAPLLTFWMTTWSPDCDTPSRILKELIQDEKIGEKEGGVGFVEVEMDSPDLGGLSGVGMMRYGVDKIPTLMAFDRGEAQVQSRVTGKGELESREFLRGWIERKAKRHGEGGAGGAGLGGIGGMLGGLFGRS